MDKLFMINKNYYKLAYYNFVKQSKAKPVLYLLTNNLNLYISQIFRAFNFLSVCFALQNIFSLIKRIRHYEGNARSNPQKRDFIILDCFVRQSRTLVSLAMTVKNNFSILNLVKSFLTSINFDSLSRKIKNLQ